MLGWNEEIAKICVSILMDYTGEITEDEAYHCFYSIPLMYPSLCAALLFEHEEFNTERARTLRDFLIKMNGKEVELF